MDGDELAQAANRIFEQAVHISGPDRSTFLQLACLGDPKLRDYVMQLLAEFEKVSDDVSSPVKGDALRLNAIRPPEFRGNRRFSIQRHIGAGAFGSVFQVWDCEQRTVVALKLLQTWKPEALFRFKKEFRSLVEVRHPNLVQLYELFHDVDVWFFTMELVDGQTFLEYVRPKGAGCQFDRLRSSLAQLIRGVCFLHQTNRIHRDLKPGNVLVDRGGRVVVLDFGLVREVALDLANETMSLVGTPAFMSPEQIVNRHVTQASDWYSVGIMLFQGLTGKLPYGKSMVEGWIGGQQAAVPRPREINPDVPKDLDDLCSRLIERLPGKRPSAEELLRIAETLQDSGPIVTKINATAAGDKFVGRQEQLAELEAALNNTSKGNLNVVLLEGASGIGKSALIRKFLLQASERYRNMVALTGRCYEFESVPYKGVDPVIDKLSELLHRCSDLEAQALLPMDASLLPTLFPVLGRIPAIAEAPMSPLVPDAQELRQRTFAALREMFARLASRQPLILWIDDFQWADRDSSTLLAELCSPPHQPALLLLLSYRNEEVSSNPTLQYLGKVLVSNNRVLGSWRHITLTGLREQESELLLQQLVQPQTTEVVRTKIIGEAGGHPLFIRELALLADSSASLTQQTGGGDISLQDVLRGRISVLPDFLRELLEIICLAAQPLTQQLVFGSVDCSEQKQPSEALATLVRGNLVRVSGTGETRKLEPFHDQVRTAVLGLLTAELRRTRHRQLAKVLAAQPNTEPQLLVAHYREAGDLAAAYEAAVSAGEAAEKQLAFDRAAVFYESAVVMGDISPELRASLYKRLADALSKAGRGRDSAQAYVSAAQYCEDSGAFEMKRLAADQFMRSGYIEEGMKLFTALSERVGIRLVRTPRGAMVAMALGRLYTRSRFLLPWPELSGSHATEVDIARLEMLRTGGVILNIVDPVAAAYFQVKYVVDALKARHPLYMPVAYALEAGIRAATGTRHPESCFSLLDRAHDLAVATGDANIQGLVYLCRSYVDYLLLLVPEGIRDSRKTMEFFRTHCTGVAWELTAAYVLLFWFKCWAGEVAEVRELLPQLLKEGAARGDVNVEVSLRLLSYVHFAYLAADEPKECLTECKKALERWSSKGYTLQHYGGMFVQVETHLYEGSYDEARSVLMGWWDKMSQSFILRWRTLKVMAFFLRGRVALACWLGNRSDEILRGEVEEYAKRLERIPCHWSAPMVCVLRGGLAAGENRRREAVALLNAAYEGFEKISLHAFASAAADHSGRLQGDLEGQMQVETAAQFMKLQKVQNPQAFVRMLIPGEWGDSA